jgi:hypothetical protein
MNDEQGTSTEKIRKEPTKSSFLFSDSFHGILGALGSLIWILMFGAGILINSKPFRDQVAASFDWYSFMMSILVYTPTNIFILCIVAAFVGGCASRLLLSRAQKISLTESSDDSLKKDDSYIYMNENPFGSLLRGMVVYFAFLAGVFVANSNLFFDPTPQGYTQAAGVVSLLSFLMGYDPTMFSSFLKVANKVQGKQ